MNLPVNLVLRILSGEKLEKGSGKNSAWWLGALALFPVIILGFGFLCGWIERTTRFSLTDSYLGILGLVLMLVIFTFASLALCVRGFSRHPLWLIPIAVMTWGGTAYLVLRHDQERPVSPFTNTDRP